MKYILRTIASPFVLIICLIAHIYHALRLTILFIKHGGEFISYEKKNEKQTIAKMYYDLKEQMNKEN